MYVYICLYCKFLFSDLQNNGSQKLAVLEQKQGQFWNLHEILHNVTPKYFHISGIKYFCCRSKVKKISVLRNNRRTV